MRTTSRFYKPIPLATGIKATLAGVSMLSFIPVSVGADTPPASQNTQSQSLDKLRQFYQPMPSDDARCHGAWIQPARQSIKPTEESTDNEPTPTPFGGGGLDIYAQADYGYWDNDDYAELSGNVIVEQNGQQITAERLTLKPSTGDITADGQVFFSDGNSTTNTQTNNGSVFGAGMMGVAEKIQYTNNGNSAIAEDVAFASTTIKAHGHAKKLQKQSQDRYHLEDVMFSTCPPDKRRWHLDADSIDIDTETGRGIAKNSTLKISDVPVFSLPYFNFPIDDRRSSGFLLPSAGVSSDGVEIHTPYYLNLAPNYDLTLTPTIFSNKNPMITGEFRYLTEKVGSGTLTGAYLPSDRQYGHQDRSRLFYDHEWRSKKLPTFSINGSYRYVSDRDYLNDFDTLGIENNPLNLPRRVWATYYDDHVSADLRVETFQTLEGKRADGTIISDKDKPYSRLPQLSLSYTLPTIESEHLSKLRVQGTHHTAYFKKSINDGSELEKSGMRMHNQISAEYSWVKPWGYIKPKVGLAHLYASYDEDSLAGQNLSKAEGQYSVVAPQISIDSGLFFEKAGSPFGLFGKLGGYQSIAPRLKYLHTPHKDQSDIPNFETAISAISYQQLLSDSWFLGYDRIQDLHALTPALNYRYVDNNGLTRLDASVAEQFFIDSPKVGIDNSQTFVGSHSGLAWHVSTQPKQNLWADLSGAFTPDYDLSSAVAQVRYQPNDHSLFNVGVIERKANKATNQLALSAYTASAIFPINERWRLLSQAQYDHKNDRLLDALVGVNYEDCCYGLSVYARHYRNDLNPDSGKNNAIMAEIRLNGITSGSRLNRLLSDKVMGYDHTQNAWQRTY